MRARRWEVQLSNRAAADFDEIIIWTADRFGTRQASAYRKTIVEALKALSRGPAVSGVRARDELGGNVYTLHIARGKRSGRHVIVFRIDHRDDRRVISVARILHDAMDIARHLPPENGES